MTFLCHQDNDKTFSLAPNDLKASSAWENLQISISHPRFQLFAILTGGSSKQPRRVKYRLLQLSAIDIVDIVTIPQTDA